MISLFSLHTVYIRSVYRWHSVTLSEVILKWGRAIAQAGSRLLTTVAPRVRSRVWSSGICGGQSDAGSGILRVLRFPLPICFPPKSPAS
jgi:hypothetical protein